MPEIHRYQYQLLVLPRRILSVNRPLRRSPLSTKQLDAAHRPIRGDAVSDAGWRSEHGVRHQLIPRGQRSNLEGSVLGYTKEIIPSSTSFATRQDLSGRVFQNLEFVDLGIFVKKSQRSRLDSGGCCAGECQSRTRGSQGAPTSRARKFGAGSSVAPACSTHASPSGRTERLSHI